MGETRLACDTVPTMPTLVARGFVNETNTHTFGNAQNAMPFSRFNATHGQSFRDLSVEDGEFQCDLSQPQPKGCVGCGIPQGYFFF
jgi:hypothetical protein